MGSRSFKMQVARDKETLIVATFYRAARQRRQVVQVNYPAADFVLTLDSADGGDSQTGRLPRLDASATGNAEWASVNVTDDNLQPLINMEGNPRILVFYDASTNTSNALIIVGVPVEP